MKAALDYYDGGVYSSLADMPDYVRIGVLEGRVDGLVRRFFPRERLGLLNRLLTASLSPFELFMKRAVTCCWA